MASSVRIFFLTRFDAAADMSQVMADHIMSRKESKKRRINLSEGSCLKVSEAFLLRTSRTATSRTITRLDATAILPVNTIAPGCGLMASMINVRYLDPPEWCNTDAVRRANGTWCMQYYALGGNGRFYFCEHDKVQMKCKTGVDPFDCPELVGTQPQRTREGNYG